MGCEMADQEQGYYQPISGRERRGVCLWKITKNVARVHSLVVHMCKYKAQSNTVSHGPR